MKMKNLNMGSKFAGLLFAVLVFVLVTMNERVEGKMYEVGGPEGWKEPTDDGKDDTFYKDWASKETFHVGDSLLFKYKRDSVLVVNKWGYYHCNTTRPISAFKDGNTRYNLTRLGPVFFISGNKDHCDEGQRLNVDVVSLHPTPPPKKNAGEESASVKFFTISLALLATSFALA